MSDGSGNKDSKTGNFATWKFLVSQTDDKGWLGNFLTHVTTFHDLRTTKMTDGDDILMTLKTIGEDTLTTQTTSGEDTLTTPVATSDYFVTTPNDVTADIFEDIDDQEQLAGSNTYVLRECI